jgi:hypothetical protein
MIILETSRHLYMYIYEDTHKQVVIIVNYIQKGYNILSTFITGYIYYRKFLQRHSKIISCIVANI